MKRKLNVPLFIVFLACSISVSAFQIDGVPFIRQTREQCGPASLSSVFSYYGFEIHPDVIAKETYNSKLKGALITDLENFSGASGFNTESGRGTLDTLKGFINQKKPVIVLIDLGVWFISKPHYVVLFGYSDKGFLSHDGEKAYRTFIYSDFEKMWEKAGRPYLLVYP